MEDKNTIKIYSYSKVWKVEKKIYAIGNISLGGIGINLYDVLYTLLAIGIILILGTIFPIINSIKPIYRLVMFPYGITWLFRRKKLDGKNPIKYFFGLLEYLIFQKRTYIEKFKQNDKRNKKIKINWICSQGK